MSDNRKISICVLFCFVSLYIYLPATSDPNELSGEFQPKNEKPQVTYEKYRKELTKLLDTKPYPYLYLDYIVFPFCIIILCVIVIFFLRQIRINLISVAKDDEFETQTDLVETERAALARADTAIDSDDFRGALRYLYLSAILHLQEHNILPYDNSLTNREFLQLAHTDIELQTKLGPIISVFDEVWYGHKPCDAQTVESYRDVLNDLYV